MSSKATHVLNKVYLFLVNVCCRLGRFPPVVKTAVPVDGRFEHIVLSCNATSDHAIIWIEREAQRALNVSFPQTSNKSSPVPDSRFASAANVGEGEENGDTREAENGETRIVSQRTQLGV